MFESKKSQLWTPAKLQSKGLIRWLDASDFSTIVLSSGRVSQWQNKSSKLRHAFQSNSSSRPTYLSSEKR